MGEGVGEEDDDEMLLRFCYSIALDIDTIYIYIGYYLIYYYLLLMGGGV